MGVLISLIHDNIPPKPKFSVDDIPDLSGKVVIITGATSGIGKDTAKVESSRTSCPTSNSLSLQALLAHNAKVYIAARNPQKAEDAIQDLKIHTGKTALYLSLDLTDLKSIKAAAEEFLSKEKQLHVLFNNAYVSCLQVYIGSSYSISLKRCYVATSRANDRKWIGSSICYKHPR
jgi:retinol dehydrogenase 12